MNRLKATQGEDTIVADVGGVLEQQVGFQQLVFTVLLLLLLFLFLLLPLCKSFSLFAEVSLSYCPGIVCLID